MSDAKHDIIEVAHISVFPAKGFLHSSEGDISALAGYLNSLLQDFPAESMMRHTVLTNIKGREKCHFLVGDILVIECWKRGSISFFWSLFRTISENPKWRIIHLQHEFNQFGGVFALPLTILLLCSLRVLLRRKVVITVHEVLRLEMLTRAFLDSVVVKYPASLTRLVVFVYYHFLGCFANVLIAQDELFAETLKEQYKSRAPVKIIRIGTSIAEPTESSISRSRWKIPEKENAILFFGTLDWRKGIDILLDAWELLPKNFGRLILAGGTPTRVAATAEYQTWRRLLEARASAISSVDFTGFVEDRDLATLFGAADLVVLPYIVPQRVSAVFNQAASFGKPLIASSVFSGQADPCMLFEPDAKSLAEKLRWAFDGHLDNLQAAALDFRAKHSWRTSAFQLSEIYKQLLSPTDE